eukprot:9578833-Lingulodinium_polyedra.AAC.1
MLQRTLAGARKNNRANATQDAGPCLPQTPGVPMTTPKRWPRRPHCRKPHNADKLTHAVRSEDP